MAQSRRWQGQAPRGSLLHPVWEPVTSGDPADEAFVARCLLGAGWVGGSRRLSMLDLRVWAALCALLREQLPTPPAEDPMLGHIDTRTVHTTGYQLAERVYGDDGGKNYRLLRRSLIRLRGATVVVHIVERDPELAAERITDGYVALLGDLWLARTRLELHTPREWGALKGTTSLRAEVGHWTAQQIVAGRTTWLDLDLLRELGTGLSARTWAALEAWGCWPQPSIDGSCEETAIGLGEPACQSLGVAHYDRGRDARRALDRAGQRIVAVDPAYELVRCERRAGWCLVVRRLRGSRARAQARAGASWRSPGIAAGRRERPLRAEVRAQVRDSLDPARPKPL
jgi:hypothetical protein